MKLEEISVGIKTVIVSLIFIIGSTFTVITTFAFQADLDSLEQRQELAEKSYKRDKLWGQFIDLRTLPNRNLSDEKRILQLNLLIKALDTEIESLVNNKKESN